jgi:monofunctional biosynthetic peptidoglycan transglycosylase
MSHPRRPSLLRRLARRLALLAFVAVAGCVATVLALRYVDPPTSAFMLRDRLGTHAAEVGTPIQHVWVPWSAISPHAAVAAVAAEDQKFPHHAGFDVHAIRMAVESRLAADAGGEPLRGASTISQQVAKNLFLWPARSWLRKGIEAALTLLIEALWPKRRILEVYLNIAQFGDDVYGVEAAARHFFGKAASEVSADEAALLAAVLPNPLRLSIARPSPYVRERQRWIRRQMRQLGGVAFLDRI